MMLRRVSADRRRAGVVLLVVITLLTLFAVVGITFVLFAQSEATASRVWREGETLQRPDMDPEMLLAYFLSQLIYDSNNPQSALRGHSLARNMYGAPGSTVPFNGTGRLHTDPNPLVDDYNQINYTQFNAPVRNPDQSGSLNPSYTYPDINHPFLAAVRASDGAVLIQSYNRGQYTTFGSLDPSNPNWSNPAMRSMSLRPLPCDHAGFPPPEDAGGDVKNLADSPGSVLPGQSSLVGANNDSIWLDLAFPVMKAPDGRKFKPLFAPLIVDLDNRLNVNIHGNIRQNNFNPDIGSFAGGDQVWGPWEVNLETVLAARDRDEYSPGDATLYPEARRIFIGNATTGVKGRYNHRLENPAGLWGQLANALPVQYRVNGNFYIGSGHWDVRGGGLHTFLPGVNGTPATSCFPWFDHGAGNDSDLFGGTAHSNHPLIYNFFNPTQSYYLPNGSRDRAFAVSNMEALLRYGDRGSPALTSDLFRCCPNSLAVAKTRRLLTTHSFEVDRPGITPWLWNAPNAGTYQLTRPSGR